MRILQIGSSMPDDWGGIERYVAYLSPALAGRGHDVWAACVPGSPLASRVGIPVIPARVRAKYDLGAIARYLRIFRANRFDIVNTHFSPDYLVPAWAAKLAGQHGTVLTRHLVLPVKRGRVRAYSRLYDHYIGVSQAAADMWVLNGFPRALTSVSRAGIPPLVPTKSVSASRADLGIEEGTKAIGIFGRLIPEKGHLELFDSLEHIRTKSVCHVFGDGPLRQYLEREAAHMPVVFHGYCPAISDAMNAMDVIAVPSQWEEALGIVILEAFSLGKPVVATPKGGIPEVIQDDVNGRIWETSSPALFGEAIDELLADDEYAHRLGAAAKATYEAEFTPAKFAERTEAVYSKVLGR